MRRLLYHFLSFILLSVMLCVGGIRTAWAQQVTIMGTGDDLHIEVGSYARQKLVGLGHDFNEIRTMRDDQVIQILRDNWDAVRTPAQTQQNVSFDDYIQTVRQSLEDTRASESVSLIDRALILAGQAIAHTPVVSGIANDTARLIYGQDAVDDFQRSLAEYEGSSLFAHTMNEYMTDDGCWFCGVFESIFDSINALATTVFNNMAGDFLNLMGIGILFFILFKVGKMVVSLQEVDLMQFLNDLLGPLGRAIFAAALLGVSVTATDTVFTIITNPVIDVSMKMGQEIMRVSMVDSQIMRQGMNQYVSAQDIQRNIDAAGAALNGNNGGNGVFNTGIKSAMLSWMRSVSSSFMVGLAMGSTFISIGSDSLLSVRNNGFAMFLSGIILYIMFGMAYLAFPFSLINAFVRWAFVLTLMPLWIVLWVFPITRSYTQKAWEMFLGASLQFVTLAVMVALCVQLINHIVPAQLTAWRMDPITRSQFFTYLIEGLNDRALHYVGFGSGVIMNAIAFGLMSFFLIRAASSIAEGIVGGGAGIGVDVGQNMQAHTQAAVVPVAASAGKAGLAVGGWGVGKIKDLKDRFGNRSGSTNGSRGGSDRNETGSRSAPLGTYDGGSSGSGDKPPVVVQGPKGDKGDKGDKGENADQTENRGGNPSSSGSSTGGGLSHMTSEEKKVVESMAQKSNSVSALKNLSEDIAFVEELKAKKLDKDGYKQAIDGHQWKTENQAAMKHFAEEAYVRSNKHMPSLYGDTVAGALKEQNVVKLRTDLAPITERMRSELEQGIKASVFLADLSDSVKNTGG